MLSPLTLELNISKCWYEVCVTERKISHLLYMDDLKLIGRNEEELINEIRTAETISNDIKMEFGIVSLKSVKGHKK
jgi:hypothetical protein